MTERGRSVDRKVSNWTKSPSNVIYLQVGKPISTIISNSLTPEQIDAYITLVRIDEINFMLENNTFVPIDRYRSPSPTAIYDASGKRINVREARYRKKFEIEKNNLIDKLLKFLPEYKAPQGFKKQTKIVEKLYIKVKEFPEINFIGLLIGPRGNTLKKLQEDSGAKIAIRGKGSVKEGKNTHNLTPELNNLEDPLHCLITSDSIEKITKAKQLCQEVMDKAIFSPVGQNDLKRNQLKELAILNGTLRLDSDRICSNCGEKGHKKFDCPTLNKLNYVNQLICSNCGNVGHLSKDCKIPTNENNNMDKEFEILMKDLNGESVEESGRQDNLQLQNQMSLPSSQHYQPPQHTQQYQSPQNYQPHQAPQHLSQPPQPQQYNYNNYNDSYNKRSYYEQEEFGYNKRQMSSYNRYQPYYQNNYNNGNGNGNGNGSNNNDYQYRQNNIQPIQNIQQNFKDQLTKLPNTSDNKPNAEKIESSILPPRGLKGPPGLNSNVGINVPPPPPKGKRPLPPPPPKRN